MRLRLKHFGLFSRLIRPVLLGMLVALVAMAGEPAAAGFVGAGASPVGVWLTADGDGVIDITPCGDGVCGRIVGMSMLTRPGGGKVLDARGRPQCGLTILGPMRQTETGIWQGTITNPDDGTIWTCEFWVEPDGLHLRGYVLVPLLGRTQIWRRYTGPLAPDCRMG
jgi:uncharacterized protein (DUF2147 family)